MNIIVNKFMYIKRSKILVIIVPIVLLVLSFYDISKSYG